MIRQSLTLLVTVMGAVLVLFSFCLQTAEANVLPDSFALPSIRARIALPSPLTQSDLLASVEALIAEYPEAFAGDVRPMPTERALPQVVSRDGEWLELTFEAQPLAPLMELTTLRVQVWDAQGLLQTLPLGGLVELEGLRLVVLDPVARGAALQADDLVLTWILLKAQSGRITTDALATVLGMTPSRALAAGQVLDLRLLQEPLMVTRGAQIRVSVVRGSLLLETLATALQSGSRGALISLKNPDTGATLIARITGPNQAVVD